VLVVMISIVDTYKSPFKLTFQGQSETIVSLLKLCHYLDISVLLVFTADDDAGLLGRGMWKL